VRRRNERVARSLLLDATSGRRPVAEVNATTDMAEEAAMTAPSELAEVKPGQVWSWERPDGKRRTMLVQYVSMNLGGAKRAHGIHPQGGKRLQVLWVTLAKGLHAARLEHVVENYVYEKTR
jgi:hypothetical protein